MEIPKIQSKYITLFDTEEGYNTAKSSFEEANWSDVNYPKDDHPDTYRYSRRLSNMHKKDNPPLFKFDSIDDYIVEQKEVIKRDEDGMPVRDEDGNIIVEIEDRNIYPDAHGLIIGKKTTPLAEFRMQDYPDEMIRKIFYLESVWGYSGWEWHDYDLYEIAHDHSVFTLENDEYKGVYINLIENSAAISYTPQLLHFVNENGYIYLTDGTYYLGYKASDDTQHTSTDPDKKLSITPIYVSDESNNEYVFLGCARRFVGCLNPNDYRELGINYGYNRNSQWKIKYYNQSSFETIPGGNLYRIKNIETVPHIIDGERLYHINEFINSQDKVSLVEFFDTSNIKAINKAFKRVVQKKGYNKILPCQLNIYEFPNVTEADELFFNNKVNIIDNHTFHLPLLKEVDSFYAQGAYTEGLKFKMENLEKLTNCFKEGYFNQPVIDLNSIFEGTTLNKVYDFENMLFSAGLYAFETINDEDTTTVNFDLTNSTVPSDTIINLKGFLAGVGVCGHSGDRDGVEAQAIGFTNRRLVVNLNFSHDVSLQKGFALAMTPDKYSSPFRDLYFTTPTGDMVWYRNGSFDKVTFNFNNKEQFIKDVSYFGAGNTFIEELPITARCNIDCNDNFIYYQAVFNHSITYDFSPTHSLSYYYSQFNGATFNAGFTFRNLDCLKSIDFRNTKFPIDTADPENPVYTVFPYILNNPNYTYNQDGSRYQNFSFEGSNLGGFAVQDFYLKLADMDDIETERDGKTECEWHEINNSCFKNMVNVDFTANHKLYIQDIQDVTDTRPVRYELHMFEGCSSMKETPTIYCNINNNDRQNWFYLNGNMFNGCSELVTVNCENFNFIATNSGANKMFAFSSFYFSSKKLKYLKLGRWDAQEIIIASKVLDIPTFKATLDRQYRTFKLGKLEVMKEIYDLLALETTVYEGETMNYNQYCSHIYQNYQYKEDTTY